MLVEVELARIIIDEKRQDQIIVLREKEGERQIPIVIGFMEASSIKMTVSGMEMARPLTHDLMHAMLESLQANMMKLIIDDLLDNTFHSKIELRTKEAENLLIDARPSDGIALAVRFKAPIFVEEDILDQASILEY